MLYYNIVFKGDGEMQDSSCHLYLLSKKKPTKENPKKGDGREGRCCCYKLLLPLLLGAATAIVAAAPAGVAHMPTLCICAHPPFPPLALVFAHPHLLLPLVARAVVCLFMLVPATWLCLFGLCSCLSMLIWAHLGFVCAHSLVRAHSVVHV